MGKPAPVVSKMLTRFHAAALRRGTGYFLHDKTWGPDLHVGKFSRVITRRLPAECVIQKGKQRVIVLLMQMETDRSVCYSQSSRSFETQHLVGPRGPSNHDSNVGGRHPWIMPLVHQSSLPTL